VALHGDGGGKVPALGKPVNGRERVARILVSGLSPLIDRGALRVQLAEVNGQPGAMAFDADDQLIGVMGLGIADGQIQTIHSIVNPDKLRHLHQVGDLRALVRHHRR
jgi:RNA polymerase sigma-70 factor (ECF subfamily)